MDTSPDPARAGGPPSPMAAQPRGGSVQPDTLKPRQAKPGPAPQPTPKTTAGERDEPRGPVNKVIDHSTRFDEITTQAERAARISQLEAALSERYVVKRGPATADLAPKTTEYRFRGDTQRVAFTETSAKLATAINSPSVARSMVDVAETRQWKSLRVSGNEEFKRMVWLEASVRNIKAVGYEPTRADQALLQREREARQVNRIEPVPEGTGAASAKDKASADPAKASARGGGGGRKTVLAAIDAVLVAKKVPQAQREAVLAAATEKLANRSRETPTAKIRVYDMSAPSQRPAPTPNPEVQRTRERAGPAPAR